MSTAKRRLRESGFYGRRPAKKPLMSKVNRIRRLRWVKSHKNYDFNSVIFTDEKYWRRVHHAGRWVWRPRNMRFHPKYTQKVSQQGGGGVMVWGAISRRKVWPLVVIQGTMNALKYKKILENFIPRPRSSKGKKFSRLTFQQDNASPHKALIVSKLLSRRGSKSLNGPPSPQTCPLSKTCGKSCQTRFTRKTWPLRRSSSKKFMKNGERFRKTPSTTCTTQSQKG